MLAVNCCAYASLHEPAEGILLRKIQPSGILPTNSRPSKMTYRKDRSFYLVLGEGFALLDESRKVPGFADLQTRSNPDLSIANEITTCH